MTPEARWIIQTVADANGVAASLITSTRRNQVLVTARVEIARRLRARNYSTNQIGAVLKRDHTTIVYYLGTGKRRPKRPPWHRPRIPFLWLCRPYEGEDDPPPPPKPRKVYLVPYAGFSADYVWKERPHGRPEEISQGSTSAGAAAGQI